MAQQIKTNWVLERETTAADEARRVGVEIELSGVEPALKASNRTLHSTTGVT